ncbi:MAG: NVEALA domain-containing protein [Bacteroidaceae bacterium]|nr:NVEALA domain-containing protein [Bacteroidaceae bacterium]
MKKIIFSAAVLFAAVAGYTSYNNSNASDDEMSDLMKANIEALASAPYGCHMNNYIWICSTEYWNIGCVCGL